MTGQYPDRKTEKTKVLPDGWRWVRLGEAITEAQSGFACGERDPEGIIQIRMNNVDTFGNFVWDELLRVPADQDKISKYQLLRGDVLFNNTNSTELVGKSAIFKEYQEPVVYSNHFTRIRTKKNWLEPNYLSSWLILQWENKVFEKLCNRWIGQSAVKNDKLLSLEIPLPPISEQKRVAEILNEQMHAIEKARKATEVQLEAAKTLPAAYLRAVFNSPEAQKWPSKSIKELCERIDYGYTCSADFSLTEPRFLRITDIQDGKVNWEQVPGCKIDECTEKKATLDDGDIVFARTGGTVGKSFLIENPPRAVFASYLIRMRPKTEVSGQFLYSFFQSSNYWQQIRLNAKGGAQPNVNATILGSIQLPVPPITIQKKIVFEFWNQLSLAERLRKSLESQLETINKLPAALLRQAFNGEL